MIRNRAIINYDLGTISLDNMRFEIPETALGSKTPESLLSNNSDYIFNVEPKGEENQSSITELKSQLLKFEKENPNLTPYQMRSIKLL